jgi:hypothetical protein
VTAHSERERDLAFMAFVKTLPCCLLHTPEAGPCSDRGRAWSEADHAGERPGFRRADDDTCIPMCNRHHRDRTERRGFFARRPWAWMRAWCDEQIANVRRLWAAWQTAPF